MITILIITLLGCTWAPLVQSQPGSDLQCTAPKTTTTKVSFNSYRNHTGQWMSQVGLEHGGGPQDATKAAPRSVDVEHSTTTTCEGDEIVSIIATIAVSDSNFSSPASKPRDIPAGYELFPSVGYYKFHPDAVLWARARQVCAEEGAHLVIINSENEANVIKELFTRFPTEKIKNTDYKDVCWVGVYEQGAHGQYFTIFGSPLNTTGFERWDSGEPNEKGSNDCILVHRPTAGLHDIPCTKAAPFVCEL